MPGARSGVKSGPAAFGVNLRVTGHCHQGGRKYMEDVFAIEYKYDEEELMYAFFGIFDGHGGREAAIFAKDHLMDAITRQDNFWSEDDDLVLKSIREGFLSTQQAMWKDQANWRPTPSGLPSTAGTTASVCFIKRGKLFIGHCGDSGIVLGERDPEYPDRWRARPLTTDHKPEDATELNRIESAGGKVVNKSGVPRVVWYRPRGGHQGPVRRSTHIDEVPFLAVARALGDLWSYNAKNDVFVVSPEPDLHVYELNTLKDRCLVLATDGAWNVLSPDMAVQAVCDAERNNEEHLINQLKGIRDANTKWVNPSEKLVNLAIDRWNMCNLRADNTSIVTVILDPPGPPRAQILRRLHGLPQKRPAPAVPNSPEPPALPPKPTKGISIISRYPNAASEAKREGINLVEKTRSKSPVPSASNKINHDSVKSSPKLLKVTSPTNEPPPLPKRPTLLKGNPFRQSPRQGAHVPAVSAPQPALPVKQPRRSVVPEYNSDSENQPMPPGGCKNNSRRRSCTTASGQADKSVQPRPQPNPPPLPPARPMQTRRSEPLLAASSSRVLRPRNKGHTPDQDSPNTPTRSDKVFQLGKGSSGVMKRKRTASQPLGPSATPPKLPRTNFRNSESTHCNHTPTGRSRHQRSKSSTHIPFLRSAKKFQGAIRKLN